MDYSAIWMNTTRCSIEALAATSGGGRRGRKRQRIGSGVAISRRNVGGAALKEKRQTAVGGGEMRDRLHGYCAAVYHACIWFYLPRSLAWLDGMAEDGRRRMLCRALPRGNEGQAWKEVLLVALCVRSFFVLPRAPLREEN
jgi:hypothetical protein